VDVYRYRTGTHWQNLYQSLLVGLYIDLAPSAKDSSTTIGGPGPEHHQFVITGTRQVLPVTGPPANQLIKSTMHKLKDTSSCKLLLPPIDSEVMLNTGTGIHSVVKSTNKTPFHYRYRYTVPY
jgi:hypothetical protein